MEQRAKLAVVYFGICFIFVAVPLVSSTRVYNPQHLLKKITELLNKLKKELNNTSDNFRVEGPTKPEWNKTSNKFRVKGPTTAEWQHKTECEGFFLELFKEGTQNISDHFQKENINHCSRRIINCVNILVNKDCTKLKPENHGGCEDGLRNQKAYHFVDGFYNFSENLWQKKVCGSSFKQKYDRLQEDSNEIIELC